MAWRDRFGAVVALLSLTACGAPPHSRAAGATAELGVRTVAWNPTGANVGRVRAVADVGDVVCVFSDDGATVLTAAAVSARDAATKQVVSTDVIRGPDGDARWVVAVLEDGRLEHLRGLSSFEDVGARFGLDGKRIRAVAEAGPDATGFLLDRGIAIATKRGVARYVTSQFTRLAGGPGGLAAIDEDAVVRIDVETGAVKRFPLSGATDTAFDHDGHLVVATRRAIWVENVGGNLDLAYDAGRDALHGLVAAGGKVWFADDDRLGQLDLKRPLLTGGTTIDREARLYPASNGDVWAIAGGKLERFAAATDAARADGWSRTIAPVFARSCAGCHRAGGVSGIDLSSEAAWTQKKSVVRERVLLEGTMPPQGNALSDIDRQAIRSWVEGSAHP